MELPLLSGYKARQDRERYPEHKEGGEGQRERVIEGNRKKTDVGGRERERKGEKDL